MAEVPVPRWGRNNHTQQVQFFRVDIFGRDPELKTYLGRVGIGDILLRGFILVHEAFSAGKADIMLGEEKLATGVNLAAVGKTDITIDAAKMLNWPLPTINDDNSQELDLIIVRDAAGTPDKGLASVVIENIQRR